jgi:uncharacterized protein (DUF1501 family)
MSTPSRSAGGLCRRHFLIGASATLGAFLGPAAWPRAAHAAGSEPVLVALYLRGGADGLNLVVPADDDAYYGLRPGIQVAPGDEIALDGFFGLHPALADLLPLFDAGDLAVLHAVGSPDDSRSHFDAQDFMERAAPGDFSVVDGWLNRYLAESSASDSWQGIAIGANGSLALRGAAPSLSFTSIEEFVLEDSTGRGLALASMYGQTSSEPLRAGGSAAFSALDVIGSVDATPRAVVPPGPLGSALADAAALVRADVGVRVVTVDFGGWDHHEGQAAALPPLATQLAGGLARLREDLGDDWARTCVLVMTEFGRTAAENGSAGTDHGRASAMLVAGGGVAGGRVLLRDDAWPGLSPSQLEDGRDLRVTTDFRDVFAEILHRHMGASFAQLAPVLPRHDVEAGRMPGLFSG